LFVICCNYYLIFSSGFADEREREKEDVEIKVSRAEMVMTKEGSFCDMIKYDRIDKEVEI
jgi:hypothetical protein